MAKVSEPDILHNKIGEGTTVEGEVRSAGNIRIDGTVIGTVNSKGKVVVGPAGEVRGEVLCQNADIIGSVKGKVTVSELLMLKSTAKLEGDVLTNKLGIEPGAGFSGTCNMSGDISGVMSNGQQRHGAQNGQEHAEKYQEQSA